MPPKGKKKATTRRQEPPRQPERRQEPPRQPERRQEPPRQPERRQETADRFTLVLPPELSNLPPRQAPASQSETTLPLRQAPASQSETTLQPRQAPASQSGTTTQSLQPRQAPASQSGTTTQSLQPRQAPASQSGTTTQSLQPRQAPASQSGTTTQSLQPRQAPASQSEATFQPPLPRQAPATLLSSQETIETVPSRLQSQQSAHLEMISSQESITSRVQNQLLLSQTPELFDEPIRGGDYDTSLNYRVEDEHQFGESSTAGMVRGTILEADTWPTIPSASNRPERSTPIESVNSPLNELLPKGA